MSLSAEHALYSPRAGKVSLLPKFQQEQGYQESHRLQNIRMCCGGAAGVAHGNVLRMNP